LFSDRNIFQYHDGSALVWGDPLALQRRLYLALHDPDQVFADAASPDAAVRLPALGLLVEATRSAFAMQPFDPTTGQGATEEHCRLALEALWECLAKKKPTAASSPTSPAPTALPPQASITDNL